MQQSNSYRHRCSKLDVNKVNDENYDESYKNNISAFSTQSTITSSDAASNSQSSNNRLTESKSQFSPFGQKPQRLQFSQFCNINTIRPERGQKCEDDKEPSHCDLDSFVFCPNLPSSSQHQQLNLTSSSTGSTSSSVRPVARARTVQSRLSLNPPPNIPMSYRNQMFSTISSINHNDVPSHSNNSNVSDSLLSSSPQTYSGSSSSHPRPAMQLPKKSTFSNSSSTSSLTSSVYAPSQSSTRKRRRQSQYYKESISQSKYDHESEDIEPMSQSKYDHKAEKRNSVSQSKYDHESEDIEPMSQSKYGHKAKKRNSVPQSKYHHEPEKRKSVSQSKYHHEAEKRKSVSQSKYHHEAEKRNPVSQSKYHHEPEKRKSLSQSKYHHEPEKRNSLSQSKYHHEAEKRKSVSQSKYHHEPEKRNSLSQSKYHHEPEDEDIEIINKFTYHSDSEASCPTSVPNSNPRCNAVVNSTVARDTCAICLIDLLENDEIGRLVECKHGFCFDCILKWSKVSNRCPLCKMRFNKICRKLRSSFSSGGEIDFEEISVEDKDLIELNDDVGDEYICQVCSCGDQEEILLLCDGCDLAYHTHCVGLNEVPEGSWFCSDCEPHHPYSSRGRQWMRDLIERVTREHQNDRNCHSHHESPVLRSSVSNSRIRGKRFCEPGFYERHLFEFNLVNDDESSIESVSSDESVREISVDQKRDVYRGNVPNDQKRDVYRGNVPNDQKKDVYKGNVPNERQKEERSSGSFDENIVNGTQRSNEDQPRHRLRLRRTSNVQEDLIEENARHRLRLRRTSNVQEDLIEEDARHRLRLRRTSNVQEDLIEEDDGISHRIHHGSTGRTRKQHSCTVEHMDRFEDGKTRIIVKRKCRNGRSNTRKESVQKKRRKLEENELEFIDSLESPKSFKRSRIIDLDDESHECISRGQCLSQEKEFVKTPVILDKTKWFVKEDGIKDCKEEINEKNGQRKYQHNRSILDRFDKSRIKSESSTLSNSMNHIQIDKIEQNSLPYLDLYGSLSTNRQDGSVVLNENWIEKARAHVQKSVKRNYHQKV